MTNINLDCATDDELRAIIKKPDSHNNKIGEYAKLTIKARALRLKGNIEKALLLERKADVIYLELPPELKWLPEMIGTCTS